MNDLTVVTAPSGTTERPARPVDAPMRSLHVDASGAAPAHRGTVATPANRPRVTIRPLQSGEARDVRRIFRNTLLQGRPLPVDGEFLYSYESLCLDWYLSRGTVLVAVTDGKVCGYLLACLHQGWYDEWAKGRAIRWGAKSLASIASGGLRGDARKFVRLRIKDGLAAWRQGPQPPFQAHAHLNLDVGVRRGGVGSRLIGAMDQLVEHAGLEGWFGEMNFPARRSHKAIERSGAKIIHRQKNHTFTWLRNEPIERVTIARALTARTGALVPRQPTETYVDTRSVTAGTLAAAGVGP